MNQEWQLIKTAPKDGSKFIGLQGGIPYLTRSGKYYKKWPHEEGGPTYRELWQAITDDHVFPYQPTHWIPFPMLTKGITETPVSHNVVYYPKKSFDDGVLLGFWDENGVKDGLVVAKKNQPMPEFNT